MKRITVNYDNKPLYNIELKNDYISIKDELTRLNCLHKKICIVTDTNVSNYYLSTILDIIKNSAKEVFTFVFPAGEESKNLDTVYSLYNLLIEHKFDRKDMLIALGGGVVGDLTGYAAATYLRGISFIQIPTTLLAMVDSSIGGKTGVDFRAYKNMIGAFHQPSLVYLSLNTLKTLNKKEFQAGLAEVIKHGLIKDYSYYIWLKENHNLIMNRDISVLEELILRSCIIKKDVVEKDPKEVGDRALLNFGHTIGHAIEKLMEFKLLHGECVSIGMVSAAFLSYQKGYITNIELMDIKETLESFDLPTSIYGLDPEEILRVTKSDKKVELGNLKFILLSKIGNAIVNEGLTEDEILEAIDYVVKS